VLTSEHSSIPPGPWLRMLFSRGAGTYHRVAALCLSVIFLALSLPLSLSWAATGPPVAAVRTIRGGLTVLPPHAPHVPGRIKQPLFSAYGLSTRASQRASLRFTDGSVLFFNQFTDLVLRSPTVTNLTRGEAVVSDAPGTRHRVITPTAVASAVGTIFDVFLTPRSAAFAPRQLRETTKTFPPGTTTVSVVTGTVIVSNGLGSVTVRPGHWTHVSPGAAPTPPTRHHARLDVVWRTVLAP
jgi:FecR protein